MTENPFATTSRIINEHSNAFDDLRIIATGDGKLDKSAREIIKNAADELEASQRALIMSQANLIEANQRLIAVNDQLIAMRKAAIQPSGVQNWRMSTGWIKTENINDR